jgi:two-component system chemotaxis sensor kinase CheA
MSLAAGNLDRVAADIQLAVMRTRMQPLDKLFGKYPRLIRDLSRKTGKQIELVIEGGETEVDKSVIEELGDPLVHLMRNSADHGLEPPEERVATGKGPVGTITLSAANEGGSVKVLVKDDGRGLRREKIAGKAIERGLVSEADVANLSDKDVFNFIFLPGFSTADAVSDLSGRGVGMDVVRTNIEKLKGTIELSSTPGAGTTITITIPLTLAILPAMLVGVADEVYAIPLDAILEIVRPTAEQLTSIGDHPVMRLRETVLPLIKGSDALALPPDKQSAEQPFAVVLTQNDKRVGLMVSRLIGQQEIVVKSLDALATGGGPGGGTGGQPARREHAAISGATVRDDGGVSLIVDIAALIRRAEGLRARTG